jgi:Short C-terminal domain
MTIAASRKPSLSVGARVVFGSALVLGALSAQAYQADSSTSLSGTAPVMRGTTGRQLWRISDYTTVELVAREAGAPANQHPWTIEPNTLHALLQQVQVIRSGAAKPLFAIDELSAIVPALTEALAHARPDQDIALVSSARHEDNTFFSITAVTARLFVVDGHLNMIVHDPRVDFYDTARGSGMAPHFTVGSRTAEGTAPVQSPSAANKRGDWLVLSAASAPVAAPAAPVAPPVAQVVAPVAPAAPAVMPAPPAPAAVVVAPPAPAPAAPAAEDAEQRLTQLKRLYDKGLITKSEYEKKRQEIIKSL